MPKKTKSEGEGLHKVEVFRSDGPNGYHFSMKYNFPAWENKIVYDDGPKYVGHKLLWKECAHTRTYEQPNPNTLLIAENADGRYRSCWWAPTPRSTDIPSGMPSSVPNPDDAINHCVFQIMEDIDLNCNDSVLCYSGLLQAIPLVGGALKGVSLLNQAARRLRHSMRRKPFTTVVRSLISADFIDRFVVRPTLDDINKFIHANNYVINVCNTAAYRTGSMATSFEAKSKTSSYMKSNDIESGAIYDPSSVHFFGRDTFECSTEVKTKVLCKVNYNTAAIDPGKLWMARTGMSKPLESLWDLIPFSFVIDYVTRAGDFITGFSNALVDQDALTGRIGHVFDAWAMVKTFRGCTRKYGDSEYRLAGKELFANYGSAWCGTKGFWRTRVPFGFLTGTLLAPDRKFFHCDLTTVRKRTLAELLIQAKLR